MKSLFTLALFLLSMSLSAQDDKILISSNSEQTYYLLKSTIKESLFGDANGKFTECWVKSFSKKPLVIDKKTYYETYKMTKQMVDCNQDKFKILEIITYNRNGVSIESTRFDEYGDFINAIPESTGAEIVKGICENR